jgi:peptidoglycan/LPS O-acetylase OafA/YrhL
VEEQFYLVWPWVVFKVKSRRALIWISSSVVVLLPLLRWGGMYTLPGDRLGAGILLHSTPFRMDTLMMGALIALLYRGAGRDALFRFIRWSFWPAAGVAIAIVGGYKLHPALLPHGLSPLIVTVGFTGVAYFSAALILSSLVKDGWGYRVFSNPVLRWLGRITYGAYVFHDIIFKAYYSLAPRLHVPVWVLGLTATILISWLSFRFFESPLLDLKDRLAPSSPSHEIS